MSYESSVSGTSRNKAWHIDRSATPSVRSKDVTPLPVARYEIRQQGKVLNILTFVMCNGLTLQLLGDVSIVRYSLLGLFFRSTESIGYLGMCQWWGHCNLPQFHFFYNLSIVFGAARPNHFLFVSRFRHVATRICSFLSQLKQRLPSLTTSLCI